MSEEEDNNDIYQDLKNNGFVDEINDEDGSVDNSEFVESEEEEDEQNVFDKPVAKPVKKKRELSAEHKEKLRQGRLKALENRRKNAQQKREMKELSKKKKEIEHKVLKQEVEQYENPTIDYSQDFQKTFNFTEEQLIDLQEKAVEKYDTKRKARKQEKKKKQEEHEHTQKVKKVIHNTTSTLDNPWAYYIPQ